MRWAILVVSYPGLIKLWSAPSAESSEESTPHWTGARLLRLQTQKISLDSSAFHPVTGVAYLRKQDRLVITLFDGSFHVIRNFSSDPNWATRSAANIGEDQLTSEGLSLVSRATSSKAEKEQVSRKDMLRIDGAVLYDNNTFLWVYESTRPSDFSYKHDAKHCSTLIAAQIWKDDDDDYLLRNLGELLDTIKTSSGFSPLHLLRPYLLHLRNPIKLEALHPKFLDLLEHHSHIDHSIQVSLRELTQELNDDVRQKFRQSISDNLFGWDDLLSLRMKLSLADFAWKLASNEQNQNEIGLIAQGLLNTISHRVLRIIVRHLFAVHRALTDEDVPFVSRVIAQSMLPGCPPDLAEEGQKLYILTRTLIEGNGAVESTVPSDEIVNKLKESCPACGLEIPLQDITTAACANGHTWGKQQPVFNLVAL
ncbi:hypothetical protein D9613_012593 [Agrocybe pediades]|uniref:Transcription factor IIIC putative zinc-finger domain-containing protein n=1 Tax=Agrocybe pediades TaxID=84607 RepID=A0A8H4R3A8_9AGAR|nr:hypothetical protein D9613_012593 [Agrocybe pediades]